MVPETNSADQGVWTVAEEIDRLCDDADAVPNTFFFERRIEAADRAKVLRNVFLDSDDRWMSAFIVMLLLAGGVATFGLSQDSAATVIGSMIIAPLGAPIVGLGASLALAWPRQSLKMFGVVVGGAAAVVLAAVILGLFLPDGTPTAQILARTNPDLRDLGVAVLAGAAGAYTQTRPSLSSSLVGVAIAVALVPPLAAVGLMLEEGRWGLAKGAFTLFAANLVGITLAVAVVLLLTGFVPVPHLRERSGAVLAGLGGAVLAVTIVAGPLSVAYSRASTSAQNLTAVNAQVAATLGSTTSGVDVSKVDVNGDHVTIKVTDPGSGSVPMAADFENDLVDELGPNVKVTLE